MQCKNCSNEYDNSYPMCPKCGIENPEYIKPEKTLNTFKINQYEKSQTLKNTSEIKNKSTTWADDEPKKTKKCPHCAEEILIEAKKCKHCGETLDKRTSSSSSNQNNNSSAYARRTLISCADCGSEMSKDAAACPKCGNPNKLARGKRRGNVQGGGCLLILLGGGLCLVSPVIGGIALTVGIVVLLIGLII